MAGLRAILEPYEAHLVRTAASDSGYSLDTRHILPNKQPLFFGSVQLRKNYVSFYLMPVYVFPDLLNDISDSLRKRMQGKSCFNFRQTDPALFEELAVLTRAGFERYRSAGYV
ncbi:MAG TPA: hypothetical protein DCP32_03635 [Anaerolineaceae bacterium]|nr:MAG: hypothetical protein A2X24_09245 [Chloroflexi bacterium GWB2_54_36]HAL15861.1 hypothetical protein [Anaerolineaceae bacterium]HBA91553.1 hypothetical protein [Anaerolineaceae bacterium]